MEFGWIKSQKIEELISKNSSRNRIKSAFKSWVDKNNLVNNSQSVVYFVVTENTSLNFFDGLRYNTLENMTDDTAVFFACYDSNEELQRYWKTTRKEIEKKIDQFLQKKKKTPGRNSKDLFRASKDDPRNRYLITICKDFPDWVNVGKE